MSNLPECLQPAVEQLQKYETHIATLEAKAQVLNEHIKDLSAKNENLVHQAKNENDNHVSQVKVLEEEKLSLRELNQVVNGQLQDKSSLVETLQASKSALEDENSKVSSQSQRLNEEQADLGAQTSQLSEELTRLKAENTALKDENSALNLVNSAMTQRYEDIQNKPEEQSPLLIAEVESLKSELNAYRTGNTDTAFLQSENQRLTQRHGEITQEKMQASAKMHAAQNALQGVEDERDASKKRVEQLEFDLQGLHKLHRNLNDEKNSHVQNSKDLEFEKRALDEQLVHQEENIQQLSTEKALIGQELEKERKKADTLTQVINELRIKNEKLKSGGLAKIKPKVSAAQEPEVEALEIDSDDQMIEIVTSTKTGPSFPGEH